MNKKEERVPDIQHILYEIIRHKMFHGEKKGKKKSWNHIHKTILRKCNSMKTA